MRFCLSLSNKSKIGHDRNRCNSPQRITFWSMVLCIRECRIIVGTKPQNITYVYMWVSKQTYLQTYLIFEKISLIKFFFLSCLKLDSRSRCIHKNRHREIINTKYVKKINEKYSHLIRNNDINLRYIYVSEAINIILGKFMIIIFVNLKKKLRNSKSNVIFSNKEQRRSYRHYSLFHVQQ